MQVGVLLVFQNWHQDLTDEEALALAMEQSKNVVPGLPEPDALDWSR